MTTTTEIPGRPEVTLVPISNGRTQDRRWDTTTFDAQDGRRYVKHERLTLGRKPAYVAKWFVLEED